MYGFHKVVVVDAGAKTSAKSDLGLKQEFISNLCSEKVNEALWGEVMKLRLRYSQQQKTVNKLIQFLSALVQPRGT